MALGSASYWVSGASMVQQDNTVWSRQKTQDKIIFMNLTLELRKLNGNIGMYFFPEIYMQSLKTNSRIFTFTQYR